MWLGTLAGAQMAAATASAGALQSHKFQKDTPMHLSQACKLCLAFKCTITKGGLTLFYSLMHHTIVLQLIMPFN